MPTTRIEVDTKFLLGKGQFSKVFRGKLEELDVAVKRVLVEDLPRNVGYHHLVQQNDVCQQSNQREESALRNLDHPNVIKLLFLEDLYPFRSKSMRLFCFNWWS